MKLRDADWLAFATDTDGPGFARFQRELTRYNRHRLEPSLPVPAWRGHVRDESRVAEAEGDFVEAVRKEIAPLVADIPLDVDAFIAWFERLRDNGPGQGDPLFPWLAAQATPGTDEVVHRAGGGGGGGFRRSIGVHPGQDA